MNRPIEWQIATVKAIKNENGRAKSITLALPQWQPHRAGQHYDLRLTAADQYRVERSYSISSETERAGEIDLTIERIEDGEVSPYIHDVLIVGDRVEVRGPIGGYFVWQAGMSGPLMLIGGGSGVVPLMSMIRHRAAARSRTPARLLYSARTLDDLIYRDELERLASDGSGFQVFATLTRPQPPGWKGYARRIDEAMLTEVAKPLGKSARFFLCGPTPLVESAANGLVRIGIPAGQVRTERFGPSGS